MYESDEHWTLLTAAEYAGSFYKALAQAALKGDPFNKRRILTAFPELTQTYGPASRFHQQLRVPQRSSR
jgi:hypothetical protein